jgi:hypothetical protein
MIHFIEYMGSQAHMGPKSFWSRPYNIAIEGSALSHAVNADGLLIYLAKNVAPGDRVYYYHAWKNCMPDPDWHLKGFTEITHKGVPFNS